MSDLSGLRYFWIFEIKAPARPPEAPPNLGYCGFPHDSGVLILDVSGIESHDAIDQTRGQVTSNSMIALSSFADPASLSRLALDRVGVSPSLRHAGIQSESALTVGWRLCVGSQVRHRFGLCVTNRLACV